ncbi:prenyltransferase/squalene oxidase repeat-containing protein [Sorangium sp. So ce375]|uniref:prenyltransferase/squalene oxidase repeat-containing protein n=1 Tax=Sorangium sp. So ce375 TaxID=3133306 RepID=UPI003F5C54F5
MRPLLEALQAGVDFLIRAQRGDGHWEDYRLPVGTSDAWVTAYAGLAMSHAARSARAPGAAEAAERGARWLAKARHYQAGWGYNAHTGPDADSTAYAVMLLTATGRDPHPGDIEWLLARWKQEGGFATFDRADAWGDAHPDVTATAFSALRQPERERLRSDLLSYARRCRLPDGTWPAYWWRTAHYSTYWNLRMLSSLGCPADALPPVVSAKETLSIHTAFDLAFVVAISAINLGASDLTLALASELCELQRPDGSWPGGLNLRVTDPQCTAPWEQPRGRLYADPAGIITTASSLCALSEALG